MKRDLIEIKIKQKLIQKRLIARAIFKEDKYQKRCLEALVCPHCGEDLKTIHTYEDIAKYLKNNEHLKYSNVSINTIIICENNDFELINFYSGDFDD